MHSHTRGRRSTYCSLTPTKVPSLPSVFSFLKLTAIDDRYRSTQLAGVRPGPNGFQFARDDLIVSIVAVAPGAPSLSTVAVTVHKTQGRETTGSMRLAVEMFRQTGRLQQRRLVLAGDHHRKIALKRGPNAAFYKRVSVAKKGAMLRWRDRCKSG